MNISQCIYKWSQHVEHLNIYTICQLYLNARGEIDFKEIFNVFRLFFMSQTYKNGKVLIILYWWAWWEFITLFSWYFMHVWNFLLQKRRMIRAENFNFSITYLSCVSFLSDNAIHNVWYQTCPDLQFSFRFPIFSSAINTQQLVLLQRWRNWLLQLEVCQTAPDCFIRSPQLSQDHN